MSWMKYINLLFWVLLTYLFYLMVSLHIPYQLHQLEHTSLFVDGTDSFLQSLLQLGGFGKWVALFGTQLFAFWGIASWVFILPVLILFAVTAYLLPIIRSYALPVASWGAVSLLLSMFDYNNGWVGAVSLSLSFCVLLIISFLRIQLRPIAACMYANVFVPKTFAPKEDSVTQTGLRSLLCKLITLLRLPAQQYPVRSSIPRWWE